MQLSEEAVKQLRMTFEWAVKEARRQKVNGYRSEDKSAWYSPQRDMFNQMLNIIQSAAAVAEVMMTEKEQKKLGNLPRDLVLAVQGERGGVLCIPSIIDRHLQMEPEAVTKFITLIGYTTLFTYAMIPASAVNPEGLMESDIRSDVILTTAMGYLTDKTRAQVLEDLQIWSEELGTPAIFSERMRELSESLSSIIKGPARELGMKEEVLSES